MNLKEVTPLILTYNEEANIRDTLDCLAWADRIVIVDSFSSDETLKIASTFPQVQLYQRQFDHFAEQCNFGLTKIPTRWTLSLDADYKCPPELADEFAKLGDTKKGFRAQFRYCINGHPIRATLYPPRVVLYETRHAKYERDGHAHRVSLQGSIGDLRTAIFHDDRKPLRTWFSAQAKYATDEAANLRATSNSNLNWINRLRKQIVFAPLLTLVYCLFWKGLALDGWRGVFYTLQRVYVEVLLSLLLIDQKLKCRNQKTATVKKPSTQ